MNREDKLLQAIFAVHEAMEFGFKNVDVRFDAQDARFAAVDTRLGRLERDMRDGFASVNKRLDRLERPPRVR